MQWARQLLIAFFGLDIIFFRDSGRGQNGYLKVYHDGQLAIFNALLDDLARAIKLWLRCHGILADIEIKGHCHLGDKYGRLAKLPFTDPLPLREEGKLELHHAGGVPGEEGADPRQPAVLHPPATSPDRRARRPWSSTDMSRN